MSHYTHCTIDERKLRNRGKTRHTKGHTETRGKIRISHSTQNSLFKGRK